MTDAAPPQPAPATPIPPAGRDADAKPPLSPMKKLALGCLVGMLVVISVVCVVAAVLWRQYHRNPEYWDDNTAKIAAMQPEELAQTAEGFEQKILAVTAPPGEGEDAQPVRKVHVTCDEVNAWIAVKAAAWAAHQNIHLPQQLQGTMIAVENGKLVVAFRLETPQVQKVVSAPLDIELHPDGGATLQIAALRAGDMDVPLWALPNSLFSRPAPDGTVTQDPRQVFHFQPVRQLDARRSLRLVGFDVTGDGLDLALKTETVEKKKK